MDSQSQKFNPTTQLKANIPPGKITNVIDYLSLIQCDFQCMRKYRKWEFEFFLCVSIQKTLKWIYTDSDSHSTHMCTWRLSLLPSFDIRGEESAAYLWLCCQLCLLIVQLFHHFCISFPNLMWEALTDWKIPNWPFSLCSNLVGMVMTSLHIQTKLP